MSEPTVPDATAPVVVRETLHEADAGDAEVAARLSERFEGCAPAPSRGQAAVVVPRERLLEVAEWLLEEEGFRMLSDVTAADYLDHPERDLGEYAGEPTRFEVVLNVVDVHRNRRLRLRVPVDENDPSVPSLSGVWASADAPEREVYDLFGIVFEDHPDLTRILMPDDWEGHPLRKDYAQGIIPVQFRDAPKPE